jgi:hypothetical protein
MGWRKQFVLCVGSLKGVVKDVKDAMYPRDHQSFSNSYTKTKKFILLQKTIIPNKKYTIINIDHTEQFLDIFVWCQGLSMM